MHQIIPADGKTKLKVEFAVKFFTTMNYFFVGETPDVHWRNREQGNDKEHFEETRF